MGISRAVMTHLFRSRIWNKRLFFGAFRIYSNERVQCQAWLTRSSQCVASNLHATTTDSQPHASIIAQEREPFKRRESIIIAAWFQVPKKIIRAGFFFLFYSTEGKPKSKPFLGTPGKLSGTCTHPPAWLVAAYTFIVQSRIFCFYFIYRTCGYI